MFLNTTTIEAIYCLTKREKEIEIIHRKKTNNSLPPIGDSVVWKDIPLLGDWGDLGGMFLDHLHGFNRLNHWLLLLFEEFLLLEFSLQLVSQFRGVMELIEFLLALLLELLSLDGVQAIIQF